MEDDQEEQPRGHHATTHHEAPYVCESCGTEFDTEEELVEHLHEQGLVE
jgi:Fe2+ or Zn2+ uptake regulation protein